MKRDIPSWERPTGIYNPSAKEIGKARENNRSEEDPHNIFFRLRSNIALVSSSDSYVQRLGVGIDRQRASNTTMPAIPHSATDLHSVKHRPTNQLYSSTTYSLVPRLTAIVDELAKRDGGRV
jgi:hypothetical protein